MRDSSVKPATIEEAYRKRSGSLSRFLSRFLDSPVEIEDVLQEAFLKAFEAERKSHIRAPEAFLFKTAKNLALNVISSRRRRRTDTVADFEALPVISDVHVIANLNPETQQEIEDQLSHAQQIIQQLTPRVREVFVLRKVYGFSHKEIARELGIAISTVEKHVASGLQQMKRIERLDHKGAGAGYQVRVRMQGDH